MKWFYTGPEVPNFAANLRRFLTSETETVPLMSSAHLIRRECWRHLGIVKQA